VAGAGVVDQDVDPAEGLGQFVDDAAASGSRVRSSRRTSARRPSDRTSSAVASPAASSRNQVIPTSNPCRASATAVARPMPDSEPVTMATRPVLSVMRTG
jgi:hypothetical protein